MKKIFFVLVLLASTSFSQTNPQFVSLRPVTAVVYTPDNNPEPHIAFLIAHRTGNSLDNIEFSKKMIKQSYIID